MINFQMPIATEHQRIVASEFVRINNRSSSEGINIIGKASGIEPATWVVFKQCDFNFFLACVYSE
jgi:hypothetical protein